MTQINFEEQKNILDMISSPMFSTILDITNIEVPSKTNSGYSFSSDLNKNIFTLTYLGLSDSCDFFGKNEDIIKTFSSNEQLENIQLAVENLYFMSYARKRNIPLPIRQLGQKEYTFFNNNDSSLFFAFYKSWRINLNLVIDNLKQKVA